MEITIWQGNTTALRTGIIPAVMGVTFEADSPLDSPFDETLAPADTMTSATEAF